MKLETKLGGATGIVVCGMFLSAAAVHVRIGQSNRLTESIAGERIPRIVHLREVRTHSHLSVQAVESYLLFGADPTASREFRQQRSQEIALAEDALAPLIAAAGQPGGEADTPPIRSIQDQLAELKALEEKAERLHESGSAEDIAAAKEVVQRQALGAETTLGKSLKDLSDAQVAQANGEAAELRSQTHATLLAVWATTLLGASFAGLICLSLGRRIVGGIGLIAARADAIAAGDLTGHSLKLQSQSDDQIGTLAASMQKMQANLAAVIGTVVDTSGALIGSAASMRGATDQIHRRIDLQSQQTQQAATAMQEMSASIAEVSRHTQSAAETARSAAQTAREGGTIVKQMLVTMHSIASAVSETSSTVGQLGDDSKRISQIVTVIDEIARKTNLLALNAAIEAARAGDQGRGFAVVAGEVRRLAESTAHATGEIGSMIHEIQERTRSAIASMESGTGTVQEGVATTNQAGEALERIIGMAERVDRMITQIAIAASQQAAAADQSSASLDSIHGMSNENLAAMSATTAGIDSLRNTAVTLERQVDRFRIAGQRKPAARKHTAGGTGTHRPSVEA